MKHIYLNLGEQDANLVADALTAYAALHCSMGGLPATRERLTNMNADIRLRLSECNEERDHAYRQAAHELCQEGLEVDEDAPVSTGGEAGAYVQAWLWVSDEELSPVTP